MKDERIRKFIYIVLICLLLGILVITRVYQCPLRYIFGVPCPACGISRSLLCVATGHFAKAFYYHPLWPLAVVTAILLFLDELKFIKIPPKVRSTYIYIVAFIVLGCFVLRHIMGSPIVAIHFEKSLIYKVLGILSHISA